MTIHLVEHAASVLEFCFEHAGCMLYQSGCRIYYGRRNLELSSAASPAAIGGMPFVDRFTAGYISNGVLRSPTWTQCEMATTPTLIEQRLAALESAVAALQQQIKARKGRWIDRFIGSMTNDPEFAEVVRLGREWRQSQRLPEDEKP